MYVNNVGRLLQKKFVTLEKLGELFELPFLPTTCVHLREEASSGCRSSDFWREHGKYCDIVMEQREEGQDDGWADKMMDFTLHFKHLVTSNQTKSCNKKVIFLYKCNYTSTFLDTKKDEMLPKCQNVPET